MRPYTRLWLKGSIQALLVAALLCLVYYLLRLPNRYLPLAYYDDGETLYHTLSILLGRVPYRDDWNHHFAGYLLPFVLAGRLLGFSAGLMHVVPFIAHVLTAIGVFLCLRFFTPLWLAFFGAVLALSARQPWVLGFYPQYEINPLWVFSLFLSLCYLDRRKEAFLQGAFLLIGLAFTFDQRAIFLALIPACALALRLKDLGRGPGPLAVSCLAGFALPSAAGLFYLWFYDALQPFWQQTIIFPSLYRSGSQSWLDLVWQWVFIHRYLLTETAILLVAALGGFVVLWREIRSSRPRDRALRRLILLSAVPLAIMPLFGARDFDYYTATWLPYLAILAVLPACPQKGFPPLLRRTFCCLLALAVIFPLGQSWYHRNTYRDAFLRGDGMREVLEYLRSNMQKEDTFFVWGYRFDPYVHLARTAPFPFANQIFVHPDNAIKGDKKRLQHVYPAYEKIFTTSLHQQPPDYLIIFDREQEKKEFSPANRKVLALAEDRYNLVLSTRGKDFLNKDIFFKLYHLK